MSIQGERDLEGLKACGRIVRDALAAMRRVVRPGVTTAEINKAGAEVLQRHGARSAPMLVYGFPSETCISVNDEIVHGIPSGRALVVGDLLKLDVTAEKDGYMTDSAVTVAVGHVSPERMELMGCARRALRAAMFAARSSRRVNVIGHAVEKEIRAGGFAVVRELTGHGIGRTIHEEPVVPNFFDPRADRVLTEGIVLAVEPIATTGSGDTYVAKDGWTIKTADGAPAVHYEHTIVITEGRPLLLTA